MPAASKGEQVTYAGIGVGLKVDIKLALCACWLNCKLAVFN